MDELPLALEHKHKIWKENIVLRRWYDIPIEYEFRGFVFDNKLTGLCQYYDEVVYPEVVKNKELIKDLVLNFFEESKSSVPITPKEYVWIWLLMLKKKKVLIVEINPFGKPDGMGTGTVMFKLNEPNDCQVIFGERPFGFRIETEPLSEANYKKMIGPEFARLVEEFC